MQRFTAAVFGAVLAVGAVMPAGAADADVVVGPVRNAVDPFYSRVLADPTDPQVNNAYAARAEDRGEHRKALAAYERVLTHHPDNAEAIAGLMRVRRYLQPSITRFFVEMGATYQSNPRQFPAPLESDDGSGFAAVGMVDERRIGAYRWRTRINTSGAFFASTDELNTFDIDGGFGPLFQVTPSIALRPALVGGYSWLDGGTLFGEGGLSLTFEGFLDGALQAVEIRGTWRSYDSRWVSDDGFVVDIRGHVARNGLIGDADALVFKPRLRWSGVDAAPGVVVPARFEPGRYVELGAVLDYYHPVSERLLAGPTFAVFQRWFADPVVVGGSDRSDTYVAPGAAVILRNVFAQNVDLRVDYRYERQNSNDPTRDFDNHIAGGRILARF